MLSNEENELLTQTGPGTAMGETLRRYWLPALLSSEIAEPDCPPVRVKLLGEELVAFRDTAGRVGILEEFCPHRRVSLWLGRNEENGLRCVYHGWKFDVAGACVDQMNEPESFANKVHIVSYPALELGGIVWTYMGPSEKTPPAPKFDLTQVPDTHRYVTRIWEECNWLQSLEGGIDTSHAPILHRLLSPNGSGTGYSPESPFVRGSAPDLELELTDYGYRYAGIRALGDQGQYVRAYHFVMPFTQIRPQQINRADGAERRHIGGHFWVPMDDNNCMVWNWIYSYGEEPLDDAEEMFAEAGNSLRDCDPSRNFRKIRNRDVHWGLDREAQRTESFSGIRGINNQDHAVQESMGAIVDRSREQLGPADKAVITARQLLLNAVSTVEDGGDPRGTNSSYYRLRAIERVLPYGAGWWQTMQHELDPEFQPA